MNDKLLEVTMSFKDKFSVGVASAAVKSKTAIDALNVSVITMRDKFVKAILSVKGLVAALLGMLIIRQVTIWLLKAAKAAREYSKSLIAFREQTGLAVEESDKLIESLQKATEHQVSLTDLTLASNRAIALLGQESIPRFRELADVAAKAASVMGISVTQAFNDIVVGIGRQSRMILDNLGIIVSSTDAYAKYAVKIGKTSDALTETERKQAFLNATIDQAQQKYGELTKQIDPILRLTATWDDLIISVGNWISQSPKVEAVLLVLSELLIQYRDEVDNAREASDDLVGEGFVKLVKGTLAVAKIFVEWIGIIINLRIEIRNFAIELDKMTLSFLEFLQIFDSPVGLWLFPQAGLLASMIDLEGAISSTKDRIADMTGDVTDWNATLLVNQGFVVEIENAIKDLDIAIALASGTIVNEAGPATRKLGDDLDEVTESAGDAKDAVDDLTISMFELAIRQRILGIDIRANIAALERRIEVQNRLAELASEDLELEIRSRILGIESRAEIQDRLDALSAEGLELEIRVRITALEARAQVQRDLEALETPGIGGVRKTFTEGFEQFGETLFQQQLFARTLEGIGRGGLRGGLAAGLPAAGAAFGPIGAAIGTLLGGLFGGKQRQRGNDPSKPVFVSDINVGNTLTDLLNITKSTVTRGRTGGINGINAMIRAQAGTAGAT